MDLLRNSVPELLNGTRGTFKKRTLQKRVGDAGVLACMIHSEALEYLMVFACPEHLFQLLCPPSTCRKIHQMLADVSCIYFH